MLSSSNVTDSMNEAAYCTDANNVDTSQRDEMAVDSAPDQKDSSLTLPPLIPDSKQDDAKVL